MAIQRSVFAAFIFLLAAIPSATPQSLWNGAGTVGDGTNFKIVYSTPNVDAELQQSQSSTLVVFRASAILAPGNIEAGSYIGVAANGNPATAPAEQIVGAGFQSPHGFLGVAASLFGWASSPTLGATPDTALARNAAGLVEVDNGTAGTFADLKLRTLYTATTGAAPGLTSCGTGSPTILAGSTDMAGEVTEGTTTTGCVVTMAKTTYGSKPSCVVTFTSISATTPPGYTVGFAGGTVTITVTNISGSGLKFNYNCTYFT